MNNFFFHLKEQFDPLQNMEIIKKFPAGKHILDKNYASSDIKCMTVAVLFEQYLDNEWKKITMSKALELWGNR